MARRHLPWALNLFGCRCPGGSRCLLPSIPPLQGCSGVHRLEPHMAPGLCDTSNWNSNPQSTRFGPGARVVEVKTPFFHSEQRHAPRRHCNVNMPRPPPTLAHLPDELILSMLRQTFPGRQAQIHALATLIHVCLFHTRPLPCLHLTTESIAKRCPLPKLYCSWHRGYRQDRCGGKPAQSPEWTSRPRRRRP